MHKTKTTNFQHVQINKSQFVSATTNRYESRPAVQMPLSPMTNNKAEIPPSHNLLRFDMSPGAARTPIVRRRRRGAWDRPHRHGPPPPPSWGPGGDELGWGYIQILYKSNNILSQAQKYLTKAQHIRQGYQY